NGRDEHLHQIITEAETNIKIDPILIPSYYEIDGNNPEDDSRELLQMLSLVNQNYKNLSNKNFCWIADDFNTFIVADSHHGTMSKQWKQDIENRKHQARNYLISGEDSLEVRNDNVQVEGVTSEIPTSSFKMNIAAVPHVTTTTAILLPTKFDVIRKFTLNSQQQFAFMIITGHLDGDNHFHTGKFFDFL
ncbi:unnamed protein product, partial [Rotaria magnacalcarata]